MTTPAPLVRTPRRLASFGALAALLAASVEATAAPPEIDADLAASYFVEARRLSERDGGALWGRPLYGPMIFLDASTGTLVANRADGGGSLRADGDVFRGPVPEELGYANTAQSWDGELWTTIMWPLPGDRYERGKLLAHEMFHRLQPELDVCPVGMPDNGHLDTGAGRTWLRLEWRALAAALYGEGPERRAALTDALLFRARRHELFPEAVSDEAALVANEGLAEYTGLRLCGLPDDALAHRAASRLLRDEQGQHLQRSFAYASGPAYGLLLDIATEAGLRGDWRAQLVATSDLVDLVARTYDISAEGPLAERAAARAEIYDGSRLMAAEEAREVERGARLERYRARFVDGRVLTLPTSDALRYSFDPYGVETLPDHGQVYGSLEVRDAWGVLAVESGGALLMRDASGSITGVRVSAPEDRDGSQASGDGWTLVLESGWRIDADAREGDVVVTR